MEKKTPNLFISLSAIGVVFVILICFVLTALWLPSVFFGLILAFIIAPIQTIFLKKWFDTKQYRKLSFLILKIRAKLLFHKLLWREKMNFIDSFRSKAASHSAIFSLFLTIVTVLVLSLVIIGSSIAVVAKAGTHFREYFFTHELAANQQDSKMLLNESRPVILISNTDSAVDSSLSLSLDKDNVRNIIDQFLLRLDDYTRYSKKEEFFKGVVIRTIDYLNQESNKKDLAQFIVEKGKTLFPPIASVVGTSFKLLFDIFMTVVFFALFLQMFARYSAKNYSYTLLKEESTTLKTTQNLSQNLLASAWLPKLSLSDSNEVDIILKEVVTRLKTWAQGYFYIVIIEIPIYILLYAFIGIPNAILFGILSGCVILLPVIGPILVFGSIIIITFATPGVSLVQMFMLLGVIGSMFLLFELLFLYPKIIGEKLGLNLVELLVVVLLGGYLFGIIGMFFAVPTASVLKFLIPKIYTSLNH